MNSVDRVDQMRSTNPIIRREKKIHMSLWTYFLDLVLHQSFCIYKTLIGNKKISEYDDDKSSADSNNLGEIFQYSVCCLDLCCLDSMDVDDHHAYGLKSWLISYTKVPV